VTIKLQDSISGHESTSLLESDINAYEYFHTRCLFVKYSKPCI